MLGTAVLAALVGRGRAAPRVLVTTLVVAGAAIVGCDERAAPSSGSSADGGPSPGGGGDAAPDARGADARAPVWSARAPLPFAQQETAVLAVGDDVYVLGGLDAAATTLAVVQVYDATTDRWRSGKPLPRPLHHVNAAVVGGRIWVTGALDGTGFAAVGDVFAFDPATSEWTPKSAMPAGSERGASMVAAIGETIYVAGGLRGGAAAADREECPPGGRGASIGAHVPRVDAFDPVTGAWTERAPMPTSRAGAAVAVVGGRVVVFGGEGDTRRASGVFPEVEAYDPSTDSWSPLPSMTTPRHGMGAATVGDLVIVPGGGTQNGLAPVAIVEALDLGERP